MDDTDAELVRLKAAEQAAFEQYLAFRLRDDKAVDVEGLMRAFNRWQEAMRAVAAHRARRPAPPHG
jgi:hypothetical protein